MPATLHPQAALGLLLALLTLPVPADEVEQPLSSEAVAYVAERLQALNKRYQARPSIQVLSEYGIGQDNDLYQRHKEHGRIPPNIGFAREVETSKLPTDPMITLGLHAALTAQLQRSPAPDEMAARVADFDRRIQALNARLAEQRDAIADGHDKHSRPLTELIADLARPVIDPDARPYPYADDLPSAKERLAGDWSVTKGLLEYLTTGR